MKYELLRNDTITESGQTLYRIRAVSDFTTVDGLEVYVGDLGGYVESYDNLSQVGKCWVCDNAWVCGNARVCDNAWVCGKNDIIWIAPIGSRNDCTTFFKNASGEISVSCGCFYGTLDAFLEAVDKTHGSNHHAQVYRLAAELAREQILSSVEKEQQEL